MFLIKPQGHNTTNINEPHTSKCRNDNSSVRWKKTLRERMIYKNVQTGWNKSRDAVEWNFFCNHLYHNPHHPSFIIIISSVLFVHNQRSIFTWYHKHLPQQELKQGAGPNYCIRVQPGCKTGAGLQTFTVSRLIQSNFGALRQKWNRVCNLFLTEWQETVKINTNSH